MYTWGNRVLRDGSAVHEVWKGSLHPELRMIPMLLGKGFEIGNGWMYIKCQLSAILEGDVSSRLGLGARLRRIADVGYAGPPRQGHRRG